MKVLIVCNSFYLRGNGLAASARTTAHYLREAGVEVKILSMNNLDPEGPQPDFCLKKLYIPIFQKIVESEGYCFALSDDKVIREAVQWADVIHLEEPFILEKNVAKVAKELGVPCVGTYHLHPENIFYTVGLGMMRLPNQLLLRFFRRCMFDWCTDIQCPTENVMERLRSNNFKARLHLIPNGAVLEEGLRERQETQQPQTDPYLIVCIGRLSREKDQMTLLRAIKRSKYRDEIQLFIAGQGPHELAIKAKALLMYKRGKIGLMPKFGFLSKEELLQLNKKAYLYVHCAVVEVEGLSCIESLQEGVVPIIAQGRLTATSQFALCPKSLFPARNARALARRIDWWIEHPDYRAEMSAKYAESIFKYDIHNSIAKLIKMYQTAIRKYKRN